MALTMWGCVLLAALAVGVAASMAMLGPGPIAFEAYSGGPAEEPADPDALEVAIERVGRLRNYVRGAL